MSSNLLLVFARTPVPGKVKTRLLPRLTPEQACELHRAMIEDTAELVAAFPGPGRILFSEEVPALDLAPGTETGRQAPGDLGAKLSAALGETFAAGVRKVVVLGSDSPHLPPERLLDALGQLDSADLVLGPTEDGGYYLLGLRRFSPEIFNGVEWGSSRACEQTHCAAERAGFRVAMLEAFYDLDEWKDLQRMAATPSQGARRTRKLTPGP